MNAAGASVEDQTAAKALVRHTFNRAAAHFDDTPLFFWDVCGRRTVELAQIGPGDRVLDVCCGTGASALPAAARVAPGGHVLGLDLAEEPLHRARAKAARLGLGNVRFAVGDMSRLNGPAGTHDAVVCVLGIYFAHDLHASLAELWRKVAPGGTLAVTTWGPRALEPINTFYLDAVAEVRPDLRPPSLSWARVNRPDLLAAAFVAAGIPVPDIHQEIISHPTNPQEAWIVVLGSGYRLLVDVMGPEAATRVRASLVCRMAEERVGRLIADLLYARVRRPVEAPRRDP